MTRHPLLMVLLAVLALVPASSRAHDDDDDDDDEREASHERHRGRTSDASARAAPGWKPYQAECGSCHLAFPPAMLPPASWKRLLGGLADHFGQNAEVDAATRAQLDTFLASFAGAPRGDAPLRITQTGWWRHEHDELRADVYQRKAIGTPANCPACHVSADQGDFRERGVKIPR